MVDVSGLGVHVMRWGEGRPVWLQHGNPTWGFLYRHVVAELLDCGVELICPDLVGLGLSDRPRTSWHTLDQHATALGAVVEKLGLRDLIFVGQDWGGPVGLRALANMPDRLSGMVLLNTVIGPPRPGFRPTAFHRVSQVPGVSELLFRGLGFPNRTLHLAQGDRRTLRGDVARAYR